MTTRPISWRSVPPFVRIILVVVALLLFLGIASSGHSQNTRGGTSDTTGSNSTNGTAGALALNSISAQNNAIKGTRSKSDLAVVAVRPISAVANRGRSNGPIQVKLGDVVAYSGLLQEEPTSTATDEPTPPGLDNYTPLVPESTPTIYVTNVDGRFFYGGSTTFSVGTQTPPAFTQVFPLINFNQPAGFTCNGTPVGANTHPLTDVDEGIPCAAIPAQATAPAPTPTLLQAGVGVLAGYQAVFSTTIYVSQPADVGFYLHSDNAFVFGVGPLNGVPGNPQPIRVSGTYNPPPPPSPTPYPTTTFRNLTILGRFNTGGCCNGQVVIRFPIAGFYPIEIDNSEDGSDGLYITLESPSTPSSTPVLNGPSPTPTATPTVLCDLSSNWCTGISPNYGPFNNELHGVAVISQDDIWAVGGHDISAEGGHSLVEFWNNVEWSVVSSPDVGTLNGVAAVSANDVWAVGDNGIIHYDGTSWTQQQGQSGAKGVSARNANDVWVVGSDIRHWTGSWNASTPVPGGGTLNGVAAVTSSIAWAVGYTGSGYPDRRPLIVRWNGSTWSTFSSPSFTTDAYLTSIDFYGNQTPEPGNLHTLDHMWVVGAYYAAHEDVYNTLTEFWNLDGGPGQWQVVDSPSPSTVDNKLNHVWLNGEGDVWAVGSYWDISRGGYATLILRWNDTGWAQVGSPAPGVSSQLLGIATIPGDLAVVTSTWAVGSYVANTYGASQTLVEHFTAITPPDNTTSYYINNIDLDKHYQFGCIAAASQRGGLIILSYGHPANWSSSLNPQYGTRLVGPSHEQAYITDPAGAGRDIRNAVDRFAKGYHTAYNGGAAGCPAVQGPAKTIVLTVGTDNIYDDLPSGEQAAHAQAWGNMVQAIKTDIASYLEIKVYAAVDAEPGFGSYSKTNAWAEAYNSTGASYFYNFGSTDGYPSLAPGDPTPVVPRPWGTSGWSTDQFYHISYGLARALSVPQIYMPQFSRDWNRVKRWSIETSQYPILQFSGELSECKSSPCGIGGNPLRRFFKEKEAWQVFWQELNGDPQTHQGITYSTDIKCSNGSTNGGCALP